MSKLNQNLLRDGGQTVELSDSTSVTDTSTSEKQEKSVEKKARNKEFQKAKNKYKHVPFKWSTYKFLLNYPKKHWKLTVIANALIVVTSVMAVYLPVLMGKLLDSTTQNNDEKKHQELSNRFLEILCIISVLSFCRALTNQIWQMSIYNDMRHDVLRQFLSFDMTFYRKYRTGEIISRMSNDLASAKAAVSGNIIMFARNVILTFSTIFVLLFLSFRLTIAVLAPIPIFAMATVFYSRLAKKMEKIGQSFQADLTALTDEIITGIVAVKSFCGEETELKKYDRQLDLSMNLAYKRGLNQGFYQLVSTFFTQLGTFMVLWYGGKLVLEHNDLSPGELASFIFYSQQLSSSSQTISDAYSKIISATGAFEGVLDMLKYQNLVVEHPDPITAELRGQIEFKNVCFTYPSTNVQVLKNLSFTVNSGQYIAFCGTSGSGKSTIIQLLERFYDPQSGDILMDGIDSKLIKLQTLRSQIGLVSQEPTLFEGTLLSNMTYGAAFYSQADIDWAVRASGAGFINDPQLFPKGLNTKVGEKGLTLSGGQKQRIAIARALLKKPKILIFDEATSALDAESEFQVQTAIDDLIQLENNKITIIVIAHRLSTIVNCSKIFVLQNGAVVEQGTHQQLLEQQGVYKALIDRQMSGKMNEQNIE